MSEDKPAQPAAADTMAADAMAYEMEPQRDRAGRAARRGAGPSGGEMVNMVIARLAQLCFLGAGAWFVYLAIEMTPRMTSSIHEIYQLMAAASGLTLWAIVGVWSAIDALRSALLR